MSRTFLKKEMKAFYLKVYRKFKICIQHLFFFLTFNITTYVCDIIKKKSQETTNARNDARNDIVTTANSVNLPIISKIKVLILNVQSKKFHHY